jgi:DNA-binding NarL/FixJ family response regulator
VLIADDHPMVRSGERFLLDVPGIEVVGEAATGEDAVRQAIALRPDVVLMDIAMPDMDGVKATSLVRRDCPSTAVIIVTGDITNNFVRGALEAGAVGYLQKGASREMLVQAVKLAPTGTSLIDAHVLPMLAHEPVLPDEPTDDAARALAGLSPREREVLGYLAAGLTNKEIARAMHYSVGTVKNIVQRTIEKLGVSDRTQAAVLAIRAGL